MNVLAKPRMSVDEFLDWAVGRPGRYELLRGEIIKMAPETVGHAAIKGAVYAALVASVRRAGVPCHVLPDGVIIRIDETTAYEPDAQVYGGERLESDALEVRDPLIVVEVLSPSTQRIDLSQKLEGHFRLPSVAHYLIVDPARPSVIHHARGKESTILTRIVTEDRILLDPPGLELALSEIYGEDA
ncbi:MAG TPA: Uma2 family endonuclease [Xanthobacteraceae bacterium]|nr:Uma2 family endonuclease [Xanthobacteraceae bacterium]